MGCSAVGEPLCTSLLQMKHANRFAFSFSNLISFKRLQKSLILSRVHVRELQPSAPVHHKFAPCSICIKLCAALDTLLTAATVYTVTYRPTMIKMYPLWLLGIVYAAHGCTGRGKRYRRERRLQQQRVGHHSGNTPSPALAAQPVQARGTVLAEPHPGASRRVPTN
jgi:hypothetical protein